MKNQEQIKKIAGLMRDLDYCMMTTCAGDGALRSRPMSNNGEVEFDGDVWFFSSADTRKVADIEADPRVQLTYTDMERWLFIAMMGEAAIVRDAEKKKELWVDELDDWFEAGPESDEIVLVKVTPRVVEYWGQEEQDVIELA